MATSRRITGLAGACVALAMLLAAELATAAPSRLGDEVPSAFPDQPQALSFGWDHESIRLEGPLANNQVSHDYFRLRYAVNPKTAVTFRYGTHNLAGAVGMASPLFDGKDQAETFTLDLALNLHSLAATPADPDNEVAFEAGSAFTMGLSASQYQTDIGQLAEEHSLLKAYLLYTTDLSPEMRAHTVFSSARLSGDGYSGSVNRVGAGLDYTLIDGRRPLTLMVNGIIDVYNFREPTFNTSRLSRFDVGLRYRVAEDWFASLGYVTINDSENDASSSGIYAGMHFVDMPSPSCEPCELPEELPEQAPEQAPPPEGAQATAPGEIVAAAPAEADDSAVAAGDDPAAGEPGAETTLVAAVPAVETEAADTPGGDDADSDGVLIPPFPLITPRHTSAADVMVRAGVDVHSPHPNHTQPEDEMLRPEPVPEPSPDLDVLVEQALSEDEAANSDTSESGDVDIPGSADDAEETPLLLTADTNAVGRQQPVDEEAAETEDEEASTEATFAEPVAAGG